MNEPRRREWQREVVGLRGGGIRVASVWACFGGRIGGRVGVLKGRPQRVLSLVFFGFGRDLTLGMGWIGMSRRRWDRLVFSLLSRLTQ